MTFSSLFILHFFYKKNEILNHCKNYEDALLCMNYIVFLFNLFMFVVTAFIYLLKAFIQLKHTAFNTKKKNTIFELDFVMYMWINDQANASSSLLPVPQFNPIYSIRGSWALLFKIPQGYGKWHHKIFFHLLSHVDTLQIYKLQMSVTIFYSFLNKVLSAIKGLS